MGFFSSKPAPAVLDAPDIEGLRKFARATDRSDPPFFAGRKTEIEEVRTRLADCIQDWRAEKKDAWKGRTTVLQGAPGAGKTALLERIGEALESEFADDELQVCPLEAEDLSNRNHSYGNLAQVLAPDLWDDANAEFARTESVGGSAGIVKGEIGESEATRASDPWEEFVASATANPGKLRPVLLLIDEVQNVPGEPKKVGRPATGPGPAFLSMLHKALKNLPVFPLYGGLAHSESRLADLGISRTSLRYVRTLEALSESERREAVHGFFDKFRVRGSAEARERQAEAVAYRSQGWPQHLHAHLQALAEGLVREELDDKGDLDALECAGLDAFVLERERESREAYYEARLKSSGFDEQPYLAAAAALRISEGHSTVARLGREIERLSAAAPENPDMELPEGTSGKEFALAMVRAGILHQGKKGALSVPIPSFLDYLESNYVSGPNAPEAAAPSDLRAPS